MIAARYIIALLSDITMLYIKYLTMLTAIKQLLYGCVYVREIIYSLKLVDYLPVHTHKHTCITNFKYFFFQNSKLSYVSLLY